MDVSRFVLSDVHGHLGDLRSVLRSADLLGPGDRWTGGAAELWVLGDLLDRGPDGVGVIDLLRDLQGQAPGQVNVLLGNHEVLALGAHAWPRGRFHGSWTVNGGRAVDQQHLDDDRLTWLRSLPAMARVGDFLLVHSDTDGYGRWGRSIEEVNVSVAKALSSGAEQQVWDLWAGLCRRYEFARRDGARRARRMLATYGGECLVHGHTVVGSLLDIPSAEVTDPLLYAGDRVLAVDGGRYDGGPLLLVRLG
ncbi:MAG: metallophosphoesterase [Nocardioides sp.]|nr:metallophosphoesterase [Nocardioides sp.]